MLRSQRVPIEFLWQTDESFQRAIFAATMSRTRFWQLWKMIRFDDKETRLIREATDKLAAINEVLLLISQRFQISFHPSASLTVDELLVRFLVIAASVYTCHQNLINMV